MHAPTSSWCTGDERLQSRAPSPCDVNALMTTDSYRCIRELAKDDRVDTHGYGGAFLSRTAHRRTRLKSSCEFRT